VNKIGQGIDRRRHLVGLILLLLGGFVALSYGYLRLCYVGASVPGRYFLMASVPALALLGGGYWLTIYRETPLERVYLLVGAVLALGYCLFFAPMAVPDETTHYLSAYRMSNYFLLRISQLGNQATLMRQVDLDFFLQFATYTDLDPQRYSLIHQNLFPIVVHSQLVEYGSSGIAMNAPLGYVASAIGIALGRMLHLGSIPVFYLGRLCNIAQYLLLTTWAIRKMPYGKSAVMLLSLLPMSLHLCASYSYDCFVLAMAMLLVAQVLSICHKEKVQRRDLILCGAFCFLLAPSKLVYAPLLLCVLLIPRDKLTGVCRRPGWGKASLLLAGVAGILVFQLATLFGYADASTTGNFLAWAGEEGFTLSSVLANPVHAVLLVANTIWIKLDYYFMTLLGGQLAWLQVSYPMYLYLPWAAMLLCACAKRDGEPDALPFHQKCGLAILVLCSAGLVLASMLISWTPLSSAVIEGVQGRYFLPCLPVVYLLLRSELVTVRVRTDRCLLFWAGVLNVAFLAWGFLFVFQAT
jgi:uncharacterized membrane protein